ncbi:MAG: hypothetical protein M2R45_01057 [Verrucomicrobia subdivision 3 bacterium]|nr:hypothetical protein [Limisphaerales bacterium]MCS1414169.1 hypothetical protein [Limisphaerales bacterium]
MRQVSNYSQSINTLSWALPNVDSDLLLNQIYRLEVEASSGLPVTFKVKRGPALLRRAPHGDQSAWWWCLLNKRAVVSIGLHQLFKAVLRRVD